MLGGHDGCPSSEPLTSRTDGGGGLKGKGLGLGGSEVG